MSLAKARPGRAKARRLKRARRAAEAPARGPARRGAAFAGRPADPPGDAPSEAGVAAHAWFVAYAAPRKEALAAAQLKARGFTAWLPTLAAWRGTGRRRERVRTAMFERYLFVGLDPAAPNLAGARAAPFVDGLVAPRGAAPRPLPGALVEALAAAERGEDALAGNEAEGDALTPGQAVRVSGGLFAGYAGRIVRLSPAKRVRVLIEALGGEMELPAAGVEAA